MDTRTNLEDVTGRLLDCSPERDRKITNWIVGYWDKAKRVRVPGHKEQMQIRRIQGMPDRRIALLNYNKPRQALSADDQTTQITIPERWIVVLQEFSHESRDCFTCDKAKSKNVSAGAHDCWKYKPTTHWTNVAYYEAWDLEDAEAMCLDITSAYQATRESEEEGFGNYQPFNGVEFAFSPELITALQLVREGNTEN